MAKRTNTSKSKATEPEVDHFAEAFNKAEGGYQKFEPGAYYAYVNKGGYKEKDNGAESWWLNFVLADGNPGQQDREWFNVIKEDGSQNTVAMGILRRHLTVLGFIDDENGIQSKEHLTEILESIEAGDPIPVVIDVKRNKTFINIDIRSHGENEDNFPEFPETDED